MSQYEGMKLIVSITERGNASELIRRYTERQVFLHVQCAGRGTATSEILDILGLGTSEKDVVLSYAAGPAGRRLLRGLSDALHGGTGISGIVFMLPLSALSNLVAAAINYKSEPGKPNNEGGGAMERAGENSLILVVCNRGYTDAVMDTAKRAGARGGTVIKARWMGTEDLEESYGLVLQSEKEIIAIVVNSQMRNEIMEAINTEHGLRTKSQAMLSALPIDDVVRLS